MAKTVKEQDESKARKSGINAGKFGSVKEERGMVYVDFMYLGKRIRESAGLEATKQNMKVVRNQLDRIEERIKSRSLHFAEVFPNSAIVEQISRLEREKYGRKESPRDVKCGLYMKKWFEKRLYSKKVQEVSMIKEESYIRLYLFPFFGNFSFADLNLSLFEDYIIWARGRQYTGKSISNYTVNEAMSLLERICKHASIVHSWNSNFDPFFGYEKLKENDLEDKIYPFKIEEQGRLIECIDPFWKPFLIVSFLTGMRLSELYGLKLSDIDMENRVIHVQRSITKNLKGQYVEGPTKNEYSNRNIEIKDDLLWKAISDQKNMIETINPEYFFCTKQGSLFHQSNYRSRYWIPSLEKSELDYRSPKQTRHSFATNCLCSNENPFWIAKILGHRDPEMVLKRYSRFVHDMSEVPDGTRISKAYSALKEKILTV